MSGQTAGIVPFNSVHLTGRESLYLEEVLASGHLCGDGPFSKRCANFFENNYGIRKSLLTTSCTDALEMCALLCRVGPGDEVILPSYTFVSTANAFMLRGAELVFADSQASHPNICPHEVERLVTPRTKVIVVVHYGGVACEMDAINDIARSNGLLVVEDAAQGIDSNYKGKPLGSLGHLSAFSFHQTKNIIAGEAGLLGINDERFAERAEILWEKGTDRSKFFRGEVDKYGWVDLGSSFLASELSAAVLWAQLEALEQIQASRVKVWDRYRESLRELEATGAFGVVAPSSASTNNGHLFAIVCSSKRERDSFIDFAKKRGTRPCFHYSPLHSSQFFAARHTGGELPNAERFGDCLVRLPLFAGMSQEQVESVLGAVLHFPWAVRR